MSSSSGNSVPPPPNPVLSAYESFVRDTPLVTRYTITTLSCSYLVSFFVDPTFAVANVPIFTLFRFELYRLVLAPLVCSSALTLIFAYISFTDHGRRLESSLGSAAFAVLLLTIGGVTNLLFLALCVILYVLSGGSSQSVLFLSSSGIWTVLLGLIAMECSRAPAGSKRKLFAFEVPGVWYPCIVLAFFSLLAGPSLAYFLSVGVGYAYGYGKLHFLSPSEARCKAWEDGCLANFTRRPGWLLCSAATGSGAWGQLPTTTTTTGSPPGGDDSWSPASFFQGNRSNPPATARAATVAGPPAGGWAAPGTDQQPEEPTFPTGGGRTLGNPQKRSNAGTSGTSREAMLAAAERRALADSAQGDANNSGSQ